MSAKTGQVVTPLFTTASPAVGSAMDADATPVGTLYLNGTANGAAVTVTNLAAGLYKAAVTMPTLVAGDRVSLSVSATVGGVTGKGIIWGDMGETATASDVHARLGAPAGASVVADIALRATAANLAIVDTVADGIAAKTVNLPASPAAVGSAMVLTAPYDAAKTAAAPGANMVATNMVAAAPLSTANAAAVRTNLTTELARIDENVSAAKTLTVGERTSVASAVSGLATTGLAALKALLDAVLMKTNTIGTGQAIVISPITPNGTITIEQGDSYRAGRSRAIDVNVDDVAHARGLDAENVTVYLLATQFTWTATSVTETVPGYQVRFEPSIVQTAAVLRGQSYKLKACIDNVAPTDDDAETIQRGKVVLNRDIPAVI